MYPRGFPWLSAAQQRKANTANALIDFTWKALMTVDIIGQSRWILGLTEHPEDLGRAGNRSAGATPASIWNSEEARMLVNTCGWQTLALHQDQFGACTPKPTRLLYNLNAFDHLGVPGWPQFDDSGKYVGPLANPAPRVGPSLMRQPGDTGAFATAATASYPSGLCQALAAAILACYKSRPASTVPALLPRGGEILAGADPELQQTAPAELQQTAPAEPQQTATAVPQQPATAETNDSDEEEDAATTEIQAAHGDEDPPKLGWWGSGPPSRIRGHGSTGRYVRDGGGYCSPGRWPPARRVLPPLAAAVTSLLQEGLSTIGTQETTDRLALAMLTNKIASTPFAAAALVVRSRLSELLLLHGLKRDGTPRDPTQAIDFELMGLLAAHLHDPDTDAPRECRRGVRIGFRTPLTASPAIWPSKVKWRLGLDDIVNPSYINENYGSATLDRKALLVEFDAQVKAGMMLRLTFKEARARWGPLLRVAAMAVIQESDKNRVIHDATNLVGVNQEIKIPDLEQYPTPADVAASMLQDGAESSGPPVRYMAIKTDGSKAHRRIPVDPRDWGLMACAIDPMPVEGTRLDDWVIYVNTVGTYGVSSASWWWGRIGALVLRLCHYLTGIHYGFRFADDFLFISRPSGGQTLRPFLLVMLLLEVLQVPLKWEKTAGGPQVEWIGFLFDFERLTAGLSPKRSLWIKEWAQKALRQDIVVVRALKGFIGRLGFAAEVLRHLKPFMAPLYAWASKACDSSALTLPAAIRLTLSWLAHKVVDRPAIHMRPTIIQQGEKFRSDAKAEGELVVVGGWEVVDGDDTSQSRWFSVTLTKSTAPWAYSKGLPYRTIAALELYASLLSVMIFSPPTSQGTGVTLALTGATDNQSNMYALRRHMTTRFPLCVVLMELASQLELRNMDLELRWRPREQNVPADSLTNNDFTGFSAAKRVEVEVTALQWLVLPWLLVESTALFAAAAEATAAGGAAPHSTTTLATAPSSGRPLKRPRGPGLRQSDPW